MTIVRSLLVCIFILAPISTIHAEKYIDWQTHLFTAIEHGDTLAMKEALSKGANLKTKNSEGYTALLWAVKHGHEELVRILLDKGADISATNNSLMNSMDLALTEGHADIVMLLMADAPEPKGVYRVPNLVRLLTRPYFCRLHRRYHHHHHDRQTHVKASKI